MHNHQYQAEERAYIASEEPAEEEPVDACFLIVIPVAHRTHPPARCVVAWKTVSKESGGVDKENRHGQSGYGK